MTDYKLLLAQAEALTEGISRVNANLCNISALLFYSLEDINWAGFYFKDGEDLVLDVFQGRPACVRLKKGRGVCQKAFMSGKVVNVRDVHAFPGHIACDSASKSEIVLPLFKDGEVVGVLDIDSPVPDRFDETDERELSKLASFVEQLI